MRGDRRDYQCWILKIREGIYTVVTEEVDVVHGLLEERSLIMIRKMMPLYEA